MNDPYLQVNRNIFNTYQDSGFKLSKGIVLGLNSGIELQQGFQRESYICQETCLGKDSIVASASAELVLDIFSELLKLLGSQVSVILQTSHDQDHGSYQDLFVPNIDMSVLLSVLEGSTNEDPNLLTTESDVCFKDFLLHDGCTGIGVINEFTSNDSVNEVWLDDHKMLYVNGDNLFRFEKILKYFGIINKREMKFVKEDDSHFHRTSSLYRETFQVLAGRLGGTNEKMFDDGMSF